MKAIRIALHELYGLFVEDAVYTVAILGWVLVAALALPHLVPPAVAAPLLFAGLAVILLENIAQRQEAVR